MANPGLDSLVEYWKMDEASGDMLGAHAEKTFTDNNSVTSDTGHVYSLARKFTRANLEYFERAADADLNHTGDWTIWFWCKLASQGPGATDYRTVWGDTAAFPGGIDLKFAYNNRIAIGVKQDGLWDYIHTDHGGDAIDAWTFWAGWYDSVTETIYGSYNNQAVPDSNPADKPNAWSQIIRIGGKGSGAINFDGLIGPMAFHNAVLTADELTEIYNNGDGLAYEALTAQSPAGYNKVDLSLGIRL